MRGGGRERPGKRTVVGAQAGVGGAHHRARMQRGRTHLVLAAHALDVDLEVQLAHAADDDLPGLAVAGHLQMRSVRDTSEVCVVGV